MVGRKTRRSRRKGKCSAILKSKSKIAFLALLVFSSILIAETAYSLLVPFNYPTKNLEDKIRLRSMEDRPPIPPEIEGALFSSVLFLDSPINTKQRFEVDLNLLSEVEIDWICEVRLTEDATAHWVNTTFLKYEEVNNIEASLDGQDLSLYIWEYEGVKYYMIPGLNLTERDEVKKYEIRFEIERTLYNTPFVRKPWLFNDNYAKFINFPIGEIPIETGKTSDLSTYKVVFNLPFWTISIRQSGWVDAFVPPKSEWILVNPQYGTYEYMMFEYPIEQEYKKEGNTYFFKTNFSKDNIANTVKIILVPEWQIPIMLLIFLASPFYIPIYAFLEKKKKLESKELNTRSKPYKIAKSLLSLLKLYLGPVFFILSYLLTGGKINIQMISYMGEIVSLNFLGLISIFTYPILAYLIFSKCQKEAK